jgi:hypothetical protein
METEKKCGVESRDPMSRWLAADEVEHVATQTRGAHSTRYKERLHLHWYWSRMMPVALTSGRRSRRHGQERSGRRLLMAKRQTQSYPGGGRRWSSQRWSNTARLYRSK